MFEGSSLFVRSKNGRILGGCCSQLYSVAPYVRFESLPAHRYTGGTVIKFVRFR